MHINFLSTRRLARCTQLLLLCSILITGCTHTPAEIWQRDTQAISNPPTPSATHPSTTDETTVVIYVYPKSGAVNQGQYFRLPLLNQKPDN